MVDPADVTIERTDLLSRREGEIPLDFRPDGEVFRLPITLCVGRRRRPCLALVAGAHGDEYEGVLALHAVARRVVPGDLHGSVLIVHVANPFAFAAGQRRTPEDDRDLNRTFPGKPTGSVSERLADLLCQQVLRDADLVFSLHSGTAVGTLVPRVEFLDVPEPPGRASYEAAVASGFPWVVGIPKERGLLLSAMADLGVPLIEGEVGGRGTTRPDNVAYYEARVYDVMRYAGVMPDVTSDRSPVNQRTWALCYVPAGGNGLFLRGVELGQAVTRGDRLGHVVDAHGHLLAEVQAPADGVVGSVREHLRARPEETVCTLFVPLEPKVYGAEPARGFGGRARDAS